MMNLINADKLCEDICRSPHSKLSIGTILAIIARQPIAENKPVIHAQWIRPNLKLGDIGFPGRFTCSYCFYESISAYRYCPNCGAKMERDIENDTQ